jgi:hypothetical protein
MTTPVSLIEQTSRRLLRQRQVNALSCFLPIGAATMVVSWVVVTRYHLPAFFLIVPVFLISSGLVAALWSARREDSRSAAASLIDERVKGQERFLTLATLPVMQPQASFFALLQQDAARKGAAFVPTRDIPFRLDRKVLLAWFASVLSVLLVLFLVPQESGEFRSVAESQQSDTVLAEVEELARTLLAQGTTAQEQAAGAQLLLLAEELKNPALSPKEKQQLIEEAEKRIKLPLPQLLPFDLLKQFASDSKNDKGQGNEGDQPQPHSQPLAKANQNQEQLKKSSSAAAGNEPQGESQQEGEKKEQQPRESGGGIKFNQPQQKIGEKRAQNNQESSGQQQSAQEQTPNSQMPGTDPNRPGGQQDTSKDPDKKGPTPGPQPNPQQDKGQGSTIGGSPGERYFQPGEQPGGFLTKDARYVKVRVPAGETTDAGGNKRVESQERATPKTPYSNVPLKEGPPDQTQSQQPIPLEYRALLQ